MTERKHNPDVPDESLVGSTEVKGNKEPKPPQGSAGEADGVSGTAGDVKNQDNPTSVPAG